MHIQIQNAYSNHLQLTDQVLIIDFCVNVYLYISTPIYLHTFLFTYVHISIAWLSGLKTLNCKQKFIIIKLN